MKTILIISSESPLTYIFKFGVVIMSWRLTITSSVYITNLKHLL